MPQLMPLNWVMSSMMCLLMVMSMSMIYSIKIENALESDDFMNKMGSLKAWYW